MPKEKKPRSKSLRTAAAEAVAPAAKNFGREIAPLGTEAGQLIRSAAHTLMRPAFGAVWGAEKLFDWVETKVAELVEKIPPDERKEADIRIAGPALDNVRYLENEKEIRDIFASIIAKSMDKRQQGNMHASYIEIAKQLDRIDASIFRSIGSLFRLEAVRWTWNNEKGDIPDRNIFISVFYRNEIASSDQVTRSLENLERLKLISIDFTTSFIHNDRYKIFGDNPPSNIIRPNLPDEYKAKRIDGIITITEFGRSFFSIIS